MSSQMNLWGTHNVTSSPGLVAGPMPCDLQAGPTIDQSGPEAALASHSATQENAKEQTTSGTCGPYLPSLLTSASLQSSLESRLRQRLEGIGSPLYALTLKAWDMPSGPPIFALRALAHRISVSDSILAAPWPTPDAGAFNVGTNWEVAQARRERLKAKHRNGNGAGMNLATAALSTGWPTPMQTDGTKACNRFRANHQNGLGAIAGLAGWNTPRATDGSHGGPNQAGGALPADAALAGWVTPCSTDHKGGFAGGRIRNGEWATDRLDQTAQLVQPTMNSGDILIGSTAETNAGGQLDPAHSRWLMGYPPEWCDCGVTATQSFPKSRKLSSKRSTLP